MLPHLGLAFSDPVSYQAAMIAFVSISTAYYFHGAASKCAWFTRALRRGWLRFSPVPTC